MKENETETPETESPTTPETVETEEIVKEVLSGDWGNGATRKKALTASGYDYNNIQNEVNRISKLTERALNNEFGVGKDRVKSLGKDYDLVQWNTNRIYKEKEKSNELQ